MKSITITINCLGRFGAVTALDQVRRQIEDGFTSGLDSNEEGEGYEWSSDLNAFE
jgi:hypothetical protein